MSHTEANWLDMVATASQQEQLSSGSPFVGGSVDKLGYQDLGRAFVGDSGIQPAAVRRRLDLPWRKLVGEFTKNKLQVDEAYFPEERECAQGLEDKPQDGPKGTDRATA